MAVDPQYNEFDLTQRRRQRDPTFSGAVSTVPLSTASSPRSGVATGEPAPGTTYKPNPSAPTPDLGPYQPQYGQQVPPAPPPTAGSFKVQPVDPNKWGDTGYLSPKYSTLKTLSNFNPVTGVTPDVLKGLNASGYANFYGSGQRLGFNNITDQGRAVGFVDPFEGDFIQNWANGTNPGAQWAWNWNEPAQTTDTSTSGDSLAALFDSLYGGTQAQPAQTDLSWLGPLLASMTTQPAVTTAPYYAPPATVPATETSAPVVTEAGPMPLNLSDPSVGEAIRMLALQGPALTRGRAEVTDPLMASILQLMGA